MCLNSKCCNVQWWSEIVILTLTRSPIGWVSIVTRDAGIAVLAGGQVLALLTDAFIDTLAVSVTLAGYKDSTQKLHIHTRKWWQLSTEETTDTNYMQNVGQMQHPNTCSTSSFSTFVCHLRVTCSLHLHENKQPQLLDRREIPYPLKRP